MILVFKFLSCLLGHAKKRLDQKDKVNFKIYDVAIWETSTCKKAYYPISQEVKAIGQ